MVHHGSFRDPIEFNPYKIASGLDYLIVKYNVDVWLEEHAIDYL